MSSYGLEVRLSGLIYSKCQNKESVNQESITQQKMAFKCEGEIMIFSGKQNLREFITTRPDLKEILNGVLQVETKGH